MAVIAFYRKRSYDTRNMTLISQSDYPVSSCDLGATQQAASKSNDSSYAIWDEFIASHVATLSSIFLDLCERVKKSEKRAAGQHGWADMQSDSRKENITALESTSAG